MMLQKYYTIVIIAVFRVFGTSISIATSANSGCILDFSLNPYSSSGDCFSNEKFVNWGGGIVTNGCCINALEIFSHSLAVRAAITNGSKYVFLNGTQESIPCTNILHKKFSDMENILNCGLPNFTANNGVMCSKFTVENVREKLGHGFESLKQKCVDGLMDQKNQTVGACGSCIQEYYNQTRNLLLQDAMHVNNSKHQSNNVCGVILLIVLVSLRANDSNSIKALYDCVEDINSTVASAPASTSKETRVIWGILGLSGLALSVINIAAVLYKWERKLPESKEIEASEDEDDQCLDGFAFQKFSAKEIFDATNGFDSMNYVGEGTAGKVYRGVLANGKRVAVKHIVKDKYLDTFVREVNSVSNVRHTNLVSLLGYCDEKHEYYLVYELCSHGNLAEWLFGLGRALTWNQRLKIAIGSAHGLRFLHTYPEGCIVHRDIKPTNILLNEDLEAKLSDFGLSRVIAIEKSHVISEVRGTTGYLDPEYQIGGRLTSSSDVYSFGIVLLQLLSGRRVINLDISKPKTLDKMARSFSRGRGNLMEFADKNLNRHFSIEAFEIVLNIAVACTSSTKSRRRVSMEEVVVELEKAWQISMTTMPN